MAAPNTPMRLDAELTAAARTTAASMSRSLAQQIAHWARIGRELERSPGVTVGAVQAVLEGRGDYDSLNTPEWAIVRANGAERIEQARKGLRLDPVPAAQGSEVAELEAVGTLATIMNAKGQITLPEEIRNALKLAPGDSVSFDVKRGGQVVVHKTGVRPSGKRDRFESSRGKAQLKCRTDDLMAVLRGAD